MPSASPGRYQSRLFNFLNRQSRRFVDQCDRSVRHLKVATVWGAQILLYPVYLLVQGSLSAGRQLSNSAQSGWPQLNASTQAQKTPPSSDTPIQRVLGEVSGLELPVEALNVERLVGTEQPSNLPTFQPTTQLNLQPATASNLSAESNTTQDSGLRTDNVVIQGVATLLATRNLVLVTVQNQILDILTPQQQQKLLSKISWEVADLLRQWRLAQASNPKKAQRRLRAIAQPRLLLPVRLFWQSMAWVQTSPVAIAANLFQEATLVPSAELEASLSKLETSNLQPATFPSGTPAANQPSNLQPATSQPASVQEMLAFLDHTIAELESHQLVPGSEVVVALSEKATQSVRDRTQKLLQKLQTQFMTPGDQAKSPEVSQTNTLGIQALIYAAVDYFFGRRQSNLPEMDAQERSAILGESLGEANQLSGRDFISLPPSVTGRNQSSQGQLPEVIGNKTLVIPRNSVWGVLKRYLSFKQPPGVLSEPGAKSGVQIAKNQGVSLTAASSPDTSVPPTTKASNPNTVGIQALIYAAINHFFGRSPSNLLGTGSQKQAAIPPGTQSKNHQLSGRDSASLPPVGLSQSELSDGIEPDPWLTWSDLYGSPDASGLSQNPTASASSGTGKRPNTKLQLPEGFKGNRPVKPGNSLWGVIKRYLNFKQPPAELAAPNTGKSRVEHPQPVVPTAKPREGVIASSLETQDEWTEDTILTKNKTLSPKAVSYRSASISPTTRVTSAITTASSSSPDTELEPAHDWIETQATPTGYVKHPLEQLLTWLDLGMLWVEELAVKVLRWLRRLGG